MPPQRSEEEPLLSHFIIPDDLILENKTSEPRDLLMSERTFLSWIKCGTMLCMVSGLEIINYRFTSMSNNEGDEHNWPTKYSMTISIILCVMGLGCFIVATISYFQSLFSYKNQKVQTYGPGFVATYLGFLCVTLFVICILFLVKG